MLELERQEEKREAELKLLKDTIGDLRAQLAQNVQAYAEVCPALYLSVMILRTPYIQLEKRSQHILMRILADRAKVTAKKCYGKQMPKLNGEGFGKWCERVQFPNWKAISTSVALSKDLENAAAHRATNEELLSALTSLEPTLYKNGATMFQCVFGVHPDSMDY